MGATLSTISKLLKTQWDPVIANLFQEEAGLWSELMKRRKNWKGGDIEKLIRLGKNTGVGWRSDGDTLPTAGNQTWSRFVIDPKLLYARVQCSGPALRKALGGKAKAFLETFKSESEYQMKHLKNRANIQAWGGESGYLGVIGAADNGTKVVTLDGTGVAGAWALNKNAGARYLGQQAGEILVDIIDTDNSTIHVAGNAIGAIDHNGESSLSVTLTGATLTSVADGDFVALASGKTTSDTWAKNCLSGIQDAVKDGTDSYHGLSRSTYPILVSQVDKDTSALRPISDALMDSVINKIHNASGVNPTQKKGYRFISSLAIVSEWALGQVAARRYDSPTVNAGYSSDLSYRGIPVVADLHAPFENMWLMNLDDLVLHETTQMGYLDDDGQVLLRVANVDAYEARMGWMGEMFVENLNAQGVIRDLSETPVRF